MKLFFIAKRSELALISAVFVLIGQLKNGYAAGRTYKPKTIYLTPKLFNPFLRVVSPVATNSATSRRNFSTSIIRDPPALTVRTERPSSLKKKRLPPASAYDRPLFFWENMVCGAISRSIAQTAMHPANTMKTILQSRCHQPFTELLKMPKTLMRGAGATLLLSAPVGAINFAVLELVRNRIASLVKIDSKYGAGLDFASSAVSTICSSLAWTPQMMIMDNIMAGVYPNLVGAVKGIANTQGLKGFYSGWLPGVVGKIPSYGLTWMFFQEFKRIHLMVTKRDALNYENSVLGALSSATTCCIMIPMDTIKTRLVTQGTSPQINLVPYSGIMDCANRVLQEEGMIAFYRGLAPRLISVVPTVAIQFAVYEFLKKAVLSKNAKLCQSYDGDFEQTLRSA